MNVSRITSERNSLEKCSLIRSMKGTGLSHPWKTAETMDGHDMNGPRNNDNQTT